MKEDIAQQLNRLLGEDRDACLERESTTFDRQTGCLQSMVLFGAGVLGRQTLAGLRSLGIEPVAFADNNPKVWNSVVDGVQVLSPAAAVEEFGKTAGFVLTVWRDSGGHPIAHVTEQLQALGPVRVTSVAALYWKYPETFLPYFFLDLPHKTLDEADQIRAAFALLSDDCSRHEFLAQVRWRLWLDFPGLPPRVPWKPYLPDLFQLTGDDVFVDCGAFDGDTLRDWLLTRGSSFKHVFALEPDPINFARMQSFLNTQDPAIQSKVTLWQLAVGAEHGTLRFDAAGTAQSAKTETGSITVECACLDELFQEDNPTYIKMDIEGAEEEALTGATRIIRERAPILAICVYHRFDHLWKLPLLMRSLSEEYRFHMRPHADACWDLVCYAVPRSRAIGASR